MRIYVPSQSIYLHIYFTPHLPFISIFLYIAFISRFYSLFIYPSNPFIVETHLHLNSIYPQIQYVDHLRLLSIYPQIQYVDPLPLISIYPQFAVLTIYLFFPFTNSSRTVDIMISQ